MNKNPRNWIAVAVALTLTGCGPTRIAVQATADTIQAPFDVLAGKEPYGSTNARLAVDQSYDLVNEWDALKKTGDVNEMAQFVGDGSKFQIDLSQPKVADPQTHLQIEYAQHRYNRFLQEIAVARDFKQLYEDALRTHGDPDILALVVFVHQNPLYANALHEPGIRDKHERVMFQSAQSIHSIQSYDDFLNLYPKGAYAPEARRQQAALRQQEAARQLEIDRLAQAHARSQQQEEEAQRRWEVDEYAAP